MRDSIDSALTSICQSIKTGSCVDNLLVHVYPYVQTNSNMDEFQRDKLIKRFIAIISSVSDTARERILSIGHLVNLPEHLSTDEEITNELRQFKNFLEIFLASHDPPVAVTIARSSNDEYTPKHQVSIDTYCDSILFYLYLLRIRRLKCSKQLC